MPERNIYISYLRVIATVFVILIHASTGFLYTFKANSFDWNYSNWINAATRCAVPVFIMISGALLLHKDESVWVFYKKRIPKLLFPLLFWNLVYIIYFLTRQQLWHSWNARQIENFALTKMLNGGNAHLWYLYMVIGLYLAIPFIRKIVIQSSTRELEIFLLCWFASLFFLNEKYNTYLPKIDFGFFSGYAGYLILGYYLTIKRINWNKWLVLVAYGLAVSFVAVMTFQLSLKQKKWDGSLFGYLAPTVAVVSGLLFLFVKKATASLSTVPIWIQVIEKYSFGIYLVHIMLLNYLHPLFSKYLPTAAVIPLASLATLSFSIPIIYLLRKVPYGKLVSG